MLLAISLVRASVQVSKYELARGDLVQLRGVCYKLLSTVSCSDSEVRGFLHRDDTVLPAHSKPAHDALLPENTAMLSQLASESVAT